MRLIINCYSNFLKEDEGAKNIFGNILKENTLSFWENGVVKVLVNGIPPENSMCILLTKIYIKRYAELVSIRKLLTRFRAEKQYCPVCNTCILYKSKNIRALYAVFCY